jgi:hypothetical protein
MGPNASHLAHTREKADVERDAAPGGAGRLEDARRHVRVRSERGVERGEVVVRDGNLLAADGGRHAERAVGVELPGPQSKTAEKGPLSALRAHTKTPAHTAVTRMVCCGKRQGCLAVPGPTPAGGSRG